MHRETAHTMRRSRTLVIALLALAIIAVFGIAAQQALAIPSYEHGTAVDCSSCHTGSPSSSNVTNTSCATCHTSFVAPISTQTCWTCHTPGQNMAPVKTGAPGVCTQACHLANGTTNQHIAHTDSRGTQNCTTCHQLTASATDPNGSPHHVAWSGPVATTVKVKAAPTSIKLKASVKASCTITPAGLGASVSMTAQMKSGSKWKTAKTGTAKLANGVYSWTYKPAKKGTYRIQAAVKASATNNASTSAWATIKVK